ncbi:DUF2169 domain-containing protein [Serratia sp. S4]|uniref:DUF2169 family type VI secretion system accessory protein n=1 Tax=Serratia sp. S4 TaxID=768491 RepID=UPI00037BCBB7|nr:DUF2169 domain-containing protein [Serratia sp. S4]
MKIIKPLRLSVLNRPFRQQGKNYLGVSVMALLDMGTTPQLRPEVELWQLAAEELQTSGGVIDVAIPKARAEFLATGNAYTRHQKEKNSCAVRIDVGSLSKTLVAFGDRFWSGSQPTPPRNFESMRLDWSRAFGGAGYEENPHGIGAVEEQHNGAAFRRLPNIEPLHQRMTSPRQQPEPVSFGPLDMTWPRRFKRMGKAYDANWLKNDFPGLARDADWRVFNAASPDQWWPEQDELPPEAEWRIWNMHPEKPLQSGKLPPWRARCFINRQRGDETLFEEIRLRTTTVWFFPHRQQMMLIWQGSCRINEDDAADVLQLMPALEKNGAARSANHYRKVLAQRLDKGKGALFAFREKDLLPEELIGPWIDSEMQQTESPMQNNMQNRVSKIRELHRARLEAEGRDVNELLADMSQPEMPRLDELPEFVERLERQAEEMKAQAEVRQAEVEARQGAKQDSRPRGPESMHRMQEMLHQHADSMTAKKLAQSRESLHQMYLMAVQHQPPAQRMTGDIARIIRQRASNTMACGGDFSELDFTGADLSGMDFRGANFRKALLESADLSGCQLDGADFSEAMLARTDLRNSSLRECNLTKASLALAQCRQTDFSGANLTETQLEDALFEDCDFSRATLKTLLLRQVGISHCRFHRAELEECIVMNLTLPQLDFSEARLRKTVFQQCELQAAVFNGAWLESCNWVESKLPHAQFKAASLLTCAAVMESDLSGADFSEATLKESNLRQALLTQANFTLAKVENSDLSEADCQRANFTRANLVGSLLIRTDFRQVNFTGANLMGALMQKTQLGGADFTAANLFRADLSQSFINMETRLDNAYTSRVKTLPKRDEELS